MAVCNQSCISVFVNSSSTDGGGPALLKVCPVHIFSGDPTMLQQQTPLDLHIFVTILLAISLSQPG